MAAAVRQVYLDIETTGLKPEEGHRIVELGAVAYLDEERGGEPREYRQLVNPQRDVPEEARKIHGIGAEDLKGQPTFAKVADDFLAFVKGAKVYAHNAAFDVGFIDSELRRLDREPLAATVAEVVDTYAMARRQNPGGANSLDALARRAGINVEERRKLHGALTDARLLAEVHDFLTQKQDDLSLEQGIEQDVDMAQAASIRRVTLPPSPAAAARNREFLQALRQASGVKPILLDEED
ncbi:MAG: DNA polymerase III subunit epsilon [Betaproteobacteria bacterium AqS2]|uniref:DNA polymerase III subunit epsilon n=1 Tax=Candidatus Amphirhobacter heronislandensis TaxID=1732024 RepID=A0A930Y2E1_9GAMM|nr:DNA polymerase III subunit epsilon [Betaproteobacteria bacterium AqS2]